ncbi:MAG: Competence protein ComQ [Bacilli bacterium]|nr:Competence protein ComQ [Bacilli bacterium]
MLPEVLMEMNHIVDQYCVEQDLNELIKTFIQVKVDENSVWSEITQYAYLMLGGDLPLIQRVAAMTELIILSFDIIDDLQDKDNPIKPWMACHPKFTLNAIFTFLIAFIGEAGLLSKGHLQEIGKLLANSISGQQKDLNESVRTEADYIEMIQQKSGSLVRFACYMGCSLIDDLDKEVIARIDEMANYMGVIAQMENDLQDILRYDEKSDFLQKKRTLPILYLLNDSAEQFPILQQFYTGKISEAEFLLHKEACIQYIHDSGCIEYTQVIQNLFKERVETLYNSLPTVSPWKEKFKLLTFC